MLVTRRVEFKAYPTPAQKALLEEWTVLHARLYNACIEQRIWAYKLYKSVPLNYYHQQNELPALKKELPEYLPLGSHALQETVRRVDRAFSAFFRRVKAGQTPGFPRYKGARRYKGFTYPDKSGWKFTLGANGKHGTLKIMNFGMLKLRGKPRQWGEITTLTLMRRTTGEWFASITVKCKPEREAGQAAVGLDLGCETLIVLSNGITVENPRYLRKSLEKQRELQRRLSRLKRGGKNREKARIVLAKHHAKVANQRKDFQHQQTTKLIKDNALIATETLSIRNMTASGGVCKTGLNRSILDVGMATIRQMLNYKAAEAGGFRLVEVPTRKVKPSQTCPECGDQQKKPLGERTHTCMKCGFTASRDAAAAQVMLAWALNELGTSSPASPATSGMLTQEATPKA